MEQRRAVFARRGAFTIDALRLFLQPQRQLLLRADRPMLRDALMVGPLGNSKHREAREAGDRGLSSAYPD